MIWIDYLKQRVSQLIDPGEAWEDDDGEIAAPDVEPSTVGLLGRWAAAVVLLPLQVLMLPFHALRLFHRSGVDVDYDPIELSGSEKAWYWIKRAIMGLLLLPFFLATAPIRLLQGMLRSETREVVFILPALLMCGLLGYVFVQVFARGEVIRNRYLREIQSAVAQEDFARADIYYDRLLADGTQLSNPQRYTRMIVLNELGQRQAAEELLDSLAPDTAKGFGPAHQLKAKMLARAISLGQQDGQKLKLLEKHLRWSDDDSPATLEAWAVYYQRIGDHDQALASLKQAALEVPSYYLTAAAYEQRLNRNRDREQTLADAGEAFREILSNDPLNAQARIFLANVLVQLKRVDAAEQLLNEGLKQQSDDQIRQALSAFYVMRHTAARQQQSVEGDRMQYLFKALSIDPNYPPIYEQMMSDYLDQGQSTEARGRIRGQMEQLIAGDRPSPMAHFSLSNILWAEGERERAMFHLRQARKLAPNFVVVLNNLAWMMSQQDDPDLDRALELVEEALVSNPEDARFLDTRGTILLKMERYQDAITDLEKSLGGVTNVKAVHGRLAEAYQAIGMEDIAKIHLDKAR